MGQLRTHAPQQTTPSLDHVVDAANACDGRLWWSAVSVSKLRSVRAEFGSEMIAAAFAAGKRVAALPRNEMNSIRRMRPPPQRTTPVA
jgi:hypothetical protein